ncbi:MAG: hypothetical protein E7379_00890 [Clostridiales bacterium]|nr:hypothetical protein [Clostridiales bacterium]
MKSLLNLTFSWDGYFGVVFGTGSEGAKAAQEAVKIISTALWIVIGIVGLAAVIYGVYLGINLARATEQGKRDEAKKHLITVIISVVVTLVLVIFFLYLLPGILSAFHSVNLPENP